MMTMIEKLNWEKMNGLIPAVIQDESNQKILMLGFMNPAALKQTMMTKVVTFYSRSRQALWVKGETSGNQLQLCDINVDCDNDSLLITARPTGPICHKGTISCFSESKSKNDTITRLEKVIYQRFDQKPENSYVTKLFNSGIGRIAQKVGEEGVEVALAAALSDKAQLCDEVADLFFHVLVLLRARELSFADVLEVLKKRDKT